jgi:CMP-N-acetylneuraminic acid synthetase
LKDFNQTIILLNNNKKLLNEKNINQALNLKDDSRIIEALEKSTKVSNDFKNLFKENGSLIISKITSLLENYRNLIFHKIKYGLKSFIIESEDEQKKILETVLKSKKLKMIRYLRLLLGHLLFCF